MRVTLHLGLFFHDHRSVALIFINKDMKCIRDLKKHVSRIFEIKKFHLMYGGSYLPAEEDINVLHCGDSLWAIPKIKSGDSVVETLETVLKDNQVHKEKNKKEKDKAIVSNGVDNSLKHKKRTHDESDAIVNNNLDININTKKRKPTLEDDSENSSKVAKTSKKNKKQTDKSDSGNATSSTYSSPDSSDTNKTVSSSSSSSGAVDLSQGAKKVKSLVDSFEKKKIDFKKQLPDYNFNENNKKINIVKTIVVSDIHKPLNSSVSEHSNNVKETSTTKGQVPESSNADKKRENSDDVCTFDDSNTTTVESLESGYNSQHQKRRRNRTRKRKRVDKKYLELTESPESFTKAVPIPLKAKAAIARHVRFKDDGTIEENNLSSVITQNGHISDSSSDEMQPVETQPLNFTPIQTEPLNYTYELLPTPLLNKVAISRRGCNLLIKDDVKNSDDSSMKNFPTSTQNGQVVGEIPKNSVKNEVITVEDSNSAHQISEEFILKQPIIHKNPRPGDVLAFKILKLSENYTPEVSSRIVGKVFKYDPETAEVSINIINGQDQCTQPKGKFSLDDDDEKEEEVELVDPVKYCCSWFNLLEPRLLFP